MTVIRKKYTMYQIHEIRPTHAPNCTPCRKWQHNFLFFLFFFFFFLVGAVIRDVKVQDWLRTRNSNYLDSISGPFPTLIAPMTHGF